MSARKCINCNGTGSVPGMCSEIISVWQTVLIDDDCPKCGGTGEITSKQNRSPGVLSQLLGIGRKSAEPENPI